jgi:hypothetical protein
VNYNDQRRTVRGEPADFWLFSYDMLRQPEVQKATFGRELRSVPDILSGYSIAMLAITDSHVVATSGSDLHPIIRKTGSPTDEIHGFALAVTAVELAAADGYEVSDYRRVAVILKSGRAVFVYVTAEQ